MTFRKFSTTAKTAIKIKNKKRGFHVKPLYFFVKKLAILNIN